MQDILILSVIIYHYNVFNVISCLEVRNERTMTYSQLSEEP